MRILLVEDDDALRADLERELGAAGFAVDATASGIDAQHLGAEEPYDAAILDLGLPDRPGLEILRDWRAQENGLPVIILTARDAWYERVDGLEAGADDYVGKPFHTEELIARLNALIRRRHGVPQPQIQVAGYTLDEARQVLRGEDQVIELTGTEFKLLRYMAMHPGEVLSKTQLTEHVYEYDADKDSNVIEVYINRLRHKLGRDLIRTRRGQGYVFQPVD